MGGAAQVTPPGVEGRRYLLVSNGSARQGTTILFEALADRWRRDGAHVIVRPREMPQGVLAKCRFLLTDLPNSWRSLAGADVLVVHSAVALSLPLILMARLRGRRVVAFVWDVYPASTKAAGRLTHAGLLALYAMAEVAATSLASRCLVPSRDYLPLVAKRTRRVEVYPLWPTLRGPQEIIPGPALAGTLRIGFAGQINGARGVVDAVRDVLSWAPADLNVAVEVFSGDPLPPGLQELERAEGRLTVQHRGFLDADALVSALALLHFGLVTISRDFDLPAYPSKSMAYLAAGLPVLYSGRALPAFQEELVGARIGLVVGEGAIGRADLDLFLENYPLARDRHLKNLTDMWAVRDRVL